MKSIGTVLVIFVIFTIAPQISGFGRFGRYNQCEESRHNGNFTCVKNEDGTYNATLDCDSNGHKVHPELILRYPDFPKKTKHLTIQNCESLVLDLQCEAFDKLSDKENSSIIHISHLHFLNIDIMRIRKNGKNQTNSDSSQSETESSEENDTKDTKTTEKKKKDVYYLSDLVADTMIGVTFENIKHAHMEDGDIPSGLFRCGKTEKDPLEYFKMTNVKPLHFKGFSDGSSNVKEFIMDDVTIKPKNPEVALRVNNKNALVEIKISNLDEMNRIFSGGVSKLLITGNKAHAIRASAITFDADEFVFSGNDINVLNDDSFDGLSQITHITNNKFLAINERAFSITSKPFDPISPNHNITIFNFSNNEIHILNDEIIRMRRHGNEIYYDAFIISNNSVSCSCKNIKWFDYLITSRYDFRPVHNYWTKKENGNKCLNIHNCTLAQVMGNFHSLCESNYQCPSNTTFDSPSTFFIKDIEDTLGNTLHANREISDTNKEILKVLKNDIDNHNYNSLFTINTFCLILLLLLWFASLGYLLLVKYKKLGEFRPRQLISMRRHEMNSQASLNP